MGWSPSPEQSQTSTTVFFDNGGWMISLGGQRTVYVLKPDGWAEINFPPPWTDR